MVSDIVTLCENRGYGPAEKECLLPGVTRAWWYRAGVTEGKLIRDSGRKLAYRILCKEHKDSNGENYEFLEDI